MTAAETIEYAQTSVDQIQSGLVFVQGHLERAENLALKVDDLATTAGRVVEDARRFSRFALIVGGAVVVLGGIAVIVVIRKRRRPQNDEASIEIVT
jgi:hypothetical protein